MLKATAQKKKKKKKKKNNKTQKPSKQTLDIRDCASVTRPPLTPGCSVPPLFLHTEAGKHLNPDVAASQHARSFWYQPPVCPRSLRSHAHKVNGQDNRSTTKRRRIMWYINTVPQTSGLTKIISANGNLRSSVSLVLSWLLFLDKNSHKNTQCHVQISQSGVIKRLAMF